MRFMWIVFALLAAVSAGAVIVLTKAGLKDLDSSLSFAIQSVLILLVSWLVITVQGNWKDMGDINGRVWVMLVAAGILTAASSLFSYYALKIGEASFVVSIERLSLVFSVMFAVIFLKDKLTWQSIIGIGFMICGAVIIALGEKPNS